MNDVEKSNANNSNKPVIKILIIGEQAVGKSSLMHRYVDNTFNLNMMGTAGLDILKKTVTINDQEVQIVIYDTAGQERFRNISHQQCKNVQGVIVVYDVTDHQSFECVSSWIESINNYSGPDREKILIGNKIDLQDQIKVTTEEGQDLAEDLKIPFFETSAKDNTNVEACFLKLVENIYNKSEFSNDNNKTSDKKNKKKKDKSNGQSESTSCGCFIF